MRDLHARASPCNTGLIIHNEHVSGSSPLVGSFNSAYVSRTLLVIDLLSISIPDREFCLAGSCAPPPGGGFALACHVLGHLVLVGLRDQVNRYEGDGGHREYVEGYRERGARRLEQPDQDDRRESSGENRPSPAAQRPYSLPLPSADHLGALDFQRRVRPPPNGSL